MLRACRLTLLTCGSPYRLLAFQSTVIFKDLNTISIKLSSLNFYSVIVLSPIFHFLIFVHVSMRLNGFISVLCVNEISEMPSQVISSWNKTFLNILSSQRASGISVKNAKGTKTILPQVDYFFVTIKRLLRQVIL